MNFIMRTHPLHFTTSSTSLSWHIRLRWLKESNAVAEGDECDGWRSRMQWPKETNAIAEGVECGGWRSRMRWPKESNAVAGGDTFWTLITRDCCIILNWVHLKKSRIIFFVIVTYWQSMARFRKNDFFKWAQKIKSVFCFIPHTHEGCDVKTQLWALSKLTFQSTHPRRVWLLSLVLSLSLICFNPHTHEGCDLYMEIRNDYYKFQSTHPRRVWRINPHNFKLNFEFQSTHPRRVWQLLTQIQNSDYKFQSTHPRRVWQKIWTPVYRGDWFQSTHPRRVWLEFFHRLCYHVSVSIHTPTKGVTH